MEALPGWSNPSTDQLRDLQRLTADSSWWHRFRSSAVEERRRLLTSLIAQQNLWFALPFVELATDRDRVLARMAAQGAKTLVESLPSFLLPRLDECCRTSYWRRGTPQKLHIKALEKHGNATIACLGIASCHPRGHVREEASRGLARQGVKAFPWLLIRVSDWVREVRAVAVRASLALIEQGGSGLAIEHLGLVLRLQERDRFGDSEVMQRIKHHSCQPDAQPILMEALSSDDKPVRAFVARALLDLTDINLSDLLPRFASNCSPQVRLLAARECRRLDSEEFVQVYELFAEDPFPPVRIEMLQGLAEKDRDRAIPALRKALIDPSGWARSTARYCLRLLAPGSDDFAAIYRDHLAERSSARLVTAVHGLGETGAEDDTYALEPLLVHRSIPVRRAVIRSLVRLAPKRYTELFHKLLLDPSPGISREASEALRSNLGSLVRAELWRYFETSDCPHSRRNVLRAISVLPKWDRLELLAQVITKSDDIERDLAVTALGRWVATYNRSFLQVNPDQLKRIRIALTLAAHRIEPSLCTLIESFLPR